MIALQVEQAEPARRFLGRLVNDSNGGHADTTDVAPKLATATDWTVKPQYCLNVGLTYAGLAALGLPSSSLASFPEEFVAGAAARAERVGDTGESSPEHWKGPFASPDLHILLLLFAETEDVCWYKPPISSGQLIRTARPNVRAFRAGSPKPA